MSFIEKFYDRDINPADNFYRHANGGFIRFWGEQTNLTFHYFFESSSFKVKDDVMEIIKSIASSKNEKGTIEDKISILFKQITDSERINRQMIPSLLAHLEKIYEAADKSQLAFVLGDMHRRYEGHPFFKPDWADNFNDAGTCILSLCQRPYLLQNESPCIDENPEIRASVIKSLQDALEALGCRHIGRNAGENAVRIDSILSRNALTNHQKRENVLQMNHFCVDELKNRFPGFDFDRYLEGLRLSNTSKIDIPQIHYFETISRMFETEDLTALKDYMAAVLSYTLSGYLPDVLEDKFDAYYEAKSIQKPSKRDREFAAVFFIRTHFLEPIGKHYASEHFDEKTGAVVREMAERIKDAARKRFQSLEWYSEQAKKATIAKIDSMEVLVGAPANWPEIGMPDVSEEKDLLENIQSVLEWRFSILTRTINTRKSSDYWVMEPQAHAAFYAHATNSICLTAAFLQRPYVDLDLDAPSLYGSLGATIGHEIMHAFDDYGIENKYLGSGSVREVQTQEDRREFDHRKEQLIEMLSGTEVLPGLYANGRFCISEFLADQGGLLLAYDALHSLGADKCMDTEEGTADQRFFLALAHYRAAYESEEVIRRKVRNDNHPGFEQRVNFTVSTMDEFHRAFGTKEGDGMWRPEKDRVVMWK